MRECLSNNNAFGVIRLILLRGRLLLCYTLPTRSYPQLCVHCPLPSLSSCSTMPPRGNEGYDFTPILTHYLFLFTTILAVVSNLFLPLLLLRFVVLNTVVHMRLSAGRLVHCFYRSSGCECK